MAASILGSLTSGAKILRRSEYSREIVGLETLTETYTIRTADRQTILPLKDVTHSAFSTASTKFTRMAVETASVREQDGDISELSVTFVGLTSSTGLPQAQVKFIPTTGAQIYGAPLIVEINFVTDLTESQFASGQLSKDFPVQTVFGPGVFISLPKNLNGTVMPSSPIEPFTKSVKDQGALYYFGYCLDSLDSVRRGSFLVARASFREKQDAFGDPAFVANNRRI
jgi:hypothetical protein